MKFEELTFSTRFKLVAGTILTWGGLILMLASGSIHIVTFVFGSMMQLDGRISKMEEEHTPKDKKDNEG